MKWRTRYKFVSPAFAVFHACAHDYKYNRGLYKWITLFDKYMTEYMTDAHFELEDILKVAPGYEEDKSNEHRTNRR